MWKIMKSIGIKKKIVRIVEKMYDKTTCAAVVDRLLTERFSVSVGVRCCVVLSVLSTLPNFVQSLPFLDVVMDEIKCLHIVLHLMGI